MNPSTPTKRQVRLLSPGEVKELSRLQPMRALLKLTQTWLEIFVTIWLCEAFWHPLLYGLAVIWIGSRIFALGALLHDAAHYRFLPNKKWNDRIATYFLALPLFTNLSRYRTIHLHHHKYLGTPLDPDVRRKRGENWDPPVPKRQLLGTLLMSLSGLGALRMLYKNREFLSGKLPNHRTTLMLKIGFYGGLALILTLTGSWKLFLIYWLVPIFTWLALLFQVKELAEHAGIGDESSYLTPSRSIASPWWERLLVAPLGVGFHAEHHLFPTVPFYHLPEVHRRIKGHPQFEELIPFYSSYGEALWGMTKGREGREIPN